MTMAEEVLDRFRDQFISDMDANAVVENLEDKKIIDEGDLSKIARNENRVQRNQILHRALKQKCTDEALMEACDIIIAVKNRKMTALAEAMKEALVATMPHVPGGTNGDSQTGGQAGANGPSEEYTDNPKEPQPQPEKPKPQFAIITANGREQSVVKRYFNLERVCEEVYAELMDYDWKHDPFLKEMEVKITHNDPVGIYDVFTIGEMMGVHVNCPDYGPDGARNTTSALLQKAKAEQWPLKVIFVVGCCGASMNDAKKGQNWRGTVLLSGQLDDYLACGKAEEDGLVLNSQPYTLSKKWVNWLSDGAICKPAVAESRYKMIPVEKVGKYLSGPLVMKRADLAKRCRGENCEMAGVEMEGTGVYSIVCNWAPTTEVAVVKGISDYAGSDKKKPAKSVVFGKETAKEIDDNARQDIATFHAITLVTRCVAKNAKRL